jgi:YVTN family beta-propeller protein
MIRSLATLTLVAFCLAFAGPIDGPPGTLIVLNKTDNTAWLIDAATGEMRAELPTGTGPHEVAVNHDGTVAVVADYGDDTPGHTLTVLDVKAASVLKTIDLGEYKRPHGIVFADEQTVAVTCEENQSLIMVDIESGEVTAAVGTRQSASHMVVLAPAQPRAFVANIASGTVSVVNTETNELDDVIEAGKGAEGLDITPNGKEVWIGNRAADTITVLDAHSLEPIIELKSASFPIRVKVTPDGSKVLVSNAQSGDVAVFDAETKKEIARISMKASDEELQTAGRMFEGFEGSPVPIGILMHPDGKLAFVANTNADMISIIDLETLEVTGRIKTGRQPDGLGWSAVTP